MSAHSQLKRRFGQASAVASVSALIGALAWWFQLGEPISYDLPFAFSNPVTPTNVLIIVMDEVSHKELGETYGKEWRRSHHTELLRRLKADQSGPVIFDVFFPNPADPAEDEDFAKAIADHGQVILAAVVSPTAQPGIAGPNARAPHLPFRNAAAAWGVSDIPVERDGAIRRHSTESELYPSLVWAAATAGRAAATERAGLRFADRWLRYYGPSNAIESLSYYSVSNRAAGFFKDKIIVVGGKPRTRFLAEEVEEYRSPSTRWTGALISGVEAHTTMLLNLLRGDWLTRFEWKAEFSVFLFLSLVIGFGLRLMKPIAGAAVALAIGLAISAIGIVSALQIGFWFPWATLSGIVVPAAWLSSLAAYKQEVRKRVSESYGSPLPFPPDGGEEGEVRIPNYALLKVIGRGAYGEVWLGRNRVGMYHAVKIIFRKRFTEVTPYEREFRGIRKYMPVSLKHPGLVRILYVGRDDHAGFFYYIMELGDDENTGQEINVETYAPRNLAKDLEKRDHLPVAECVAMGIALSEPLEFLHKRGLMHRDIKPANIIFIDGTPKLADIGLVAEFSRTGGSDASYIGTEGYMAPEGPSKPTSDIYSFGKVLYEAAMGLDRRQFPTLPDWMNNTAEMAELMALNSLILKCCDQSPKKRFQSAADLSKALLDLERRLLAKQPA